MCILDLTWYGAQRKNRQVRDQEKIKEYILFQELGKNRLKKSLELAICYNQGTASLCLNSWVFHIWVINSVPKPRACRRFKDSINYFLLWPAISLQSLTEGSLMVLCTRNFVTQKTMASFFKVNIKVSVICNLNLQAWVPKGLSLVSQLSRWICNLASSLLTFLADLRDALVEWAPAHHQV